ncbi:hypothetical protein EON65_02155 [archaeon]|nr:MAG: hypothetical protein EON65_02155 [archaeon]
MGTTASLTPTCTSKPGSDAVFFITTFEHSLLEKMHKQNIDELGLNISLLDYHMSVARAVQVLTSLAGELRPNLVASIETASAISLPSRISIAQASITG